MWDMVVHSDGLLLKNYDSNPFLKTCDENMLEIKNYLTSNEFLSDSGIAPRVSSNSMQLQVKKP
jgi:hypothetical protein